jgi:hypothetical protein
MYIDIYFHWYFLTVIDITTSNFEIFNLMQPEIEEI